MKSASNMNQQKLSYWVSAAEILSALAVVITLVVLIYDVRENTSITRIVMYADLIESFNEGSRIVSQDPEGLALIEAWISEDVLSLELIDRKRLEQMVQPLFRNYEIAFLAHDAGFYGEAEWERMQRQACMHFNRAESANFMEMVEAILTRPFFQFLSSTCSEPSE